MYQYDFSRIGRARREAIQSLDDYACTVAEQCALFGITESTFHHYADGVRLRRRPSKSFVPGCSPGHTDMPLPGPALGRSDILRPEDLPMPPADVLELATISLIRSRADYKVEEIVTALRKTSKSAVYRHRKAFRERSGDLSEVEERWHHRHLPSLTSDYESPVEKERNNERRFRCWVTRPRKMRGWS